MIAATIASSLIGASAQRSAAKKMAAAAKGAERNYLREMQTALAAQKAIQPELLALERQYLPEWIDLRRQSLMGQIGTIESLYGSMAGSSGRMGQQLMSEMSPLYGQAGRESAANLESMMGAGAGLMSRMEASAARELEAGKGLTEEEITQAQQAARAALAARGLQMSGGQAAAAEAINTYNLANAREMQRRAYAQQVLGNRMNFTNAAVQYSNPLMTLLQSVNPTSRLALAQEFASPTGPQVFQPESAYSAGVYGANTQNQVSAAMGAAQAKAGMGAGLMSLTGQIAGSYLGNPGLFGGSTT